MRNKMILMYSLAPFLEEAGALLLGARHLWHPWSVRRIDELVKISYTLRDQATTLRQRGLAWASNSLEFKGYSTCLLATSVYHRYYDNDTKPPCPEAAPYMVQAATNLLFTILPVIQKIEELEYKGNLVRWLAEILETLKESPYIGSTPELSEEMMRIVGTHAILIECEGLAYMQATIEDSFHRNNKDARKTKQSDLSEDKLRDLASEIDMPFEVVKEVFETEFSSWWDQAQAYREQAQAQREIFLSFLFAKDRIKQAIRAARDPGRTTQNGHTECWGEKEYRESEMVIKTFISMFLSFKDSGLKGYLKLTI